MDINFETLTCMTQLDSYLEEDPQTDTVASTQVEMETAKTNL